MSPFSLDFEARGEFSKVVESVRERLKEKGFGTLSEIDVQGILREKVGKETEPYTILGVCNPVLAAQAIEEEPKVGVFLPCTVVIRQAGARVHIHAQNPRVMADIVGNPRLADVAEEVARTFGEALQFK